MLHLLHFHFIYICAAWWWGALLAPPLEKGGDTPSPFQAKGPGLCVFGGFTLSPWLSLGLFVLSLGIQWALN